MELFDPTPYIVNASTLASTLDNSHSTQRRSFKGGLSQRKNQVSIFTLSNGVWVKQSLPQSQQSNEAKQRKHKPSNRKIDWTSTLTHENYTKWLSGKGYAECFRYAKQQSIQMLQSYMDILDCEQEASDACVMGIAKVMKELQRAPLATGSFIQYTKTAIKRTLIDRVRRGIKPQGIAYTNYKREIEPEYLSGYMIQDEAIDGTITDVDQLAQVIVMFLECNYRPVDDVILWKIRSMEADGWKKQFTKKRRAMGLYNESDAMVKVTRVMEFLQSHIEGLEPHQVMIKLKSKTQ